MHPRHHHSSHHRPRPVRLLGLALMAFLLFSLFAHGGWWLFFVLPWAFFAFKSRGCAFGGGKSAKRKHDEKPKRRVVETADGELLEVIDEPRHV